MGISVPRTEVVPGTGMKAPYNPFSSSHCGVNPPDLQPHAHACSAVESGIVGFTEFLPSPPGCSASASSSWGDEQLLNLVIRPHCKRRDQVSK